MVMAIAIAAGCQKSSGKKDEPAAAGSASGAAASGGGGSGGPGSGRPLSVTDDEVQLADSFIAATEALANDVAAAGIDCKKAAAAITANVPKLQPMVAAGQKLKQLVSSDPAAQTWFQTNYVPKVQAAAGKMATTTAACKDDPDFMAAAKSIPMAQPPPPPVMIAPTPAGGSAPTP
jgi:hypothetical protein